MVMDGRAWLQKSLAKGPITLEKGGIIPLPHSDILFTYNMVQLLQHINHWYFVVCMCLKMISPSATRALPYHGVSQAQELLINKPGVSWERVNNGMNLIINRCQN